MFHRYNKCLDELGEITMAFVQRMDSGSLLSAPLAICPYKPFLPLPTFPGRWQWGNKESLGHRQSLEVGEEEEGNWINSGFMSKLVWPAVRVHLDTVSSRNSVATLLDVPQFISSLEAKSGYWKWESKENFSIYWMFEKGRNETQKHPIIWKVGRTGGVFVSRLWH